MILLRHPVEYLPKLVETEPFEKVFRSKSGLQIRLELDNK